MEVNMGLDKKNIHVIVEWEAKAWTSLSMIVPCLGYESQFF